jgi:hypothetical protein
VRRLRRQFRDDEIVPRDGIGKRFANSRPTEKDMFRTFDSTISNPEKYALIS